MAALWVEPAHRRQGHAGRLLDAAHVRAAALGYPTSYLCALPEMAPFYLARGFQRIERDVDGLDLFRT
jgi:N-acetylglutamate synthase-like GNAT family acetyltransferase